MEGRLSTRSWQDQQTGQKRNRTEIVAETLQLGPRPMGASNQMPQSQAPSTPPQNEILPEVQLEDFGEAPQRDEEIKVENIPF